MVKAFRSVSKVLWTLMLLAIVGSGAAWGQLPKLKRLDVGVELLRINLPQFDPAKAPHINTVQVLPGLTFKYGIGRWGLRAGLQFTHDTRGTATSTNESPTSATSTEATQGNDMGIRIGAEWSLPRYRNWIYAIADAHAHRYTAKGVRSPYWREGNQSLHQRTLGVGSQLGLGMRLRLSPNVVLGQETLLDIGIEKTVQSDKPFSYPEATINRSPNMIFLRPLARVYIAVNL
jgi:hypothetical protein